MGDNGNHDLGFKLSNENKLNSRPSEMYMESENIVRTILSSELLPKSSNGADLIFSTGWDLSQNVEFKGSGLGSHNPISVSPFSVAMLETQGTNGTCHTQRYSVDPSLVELSPNLSNFSAMVSSFGLSEYNQITNFTSPDYPSAKEHGINKISRKAGNQGAVIQGDIQNSHEGGNGSSPDSMKRKRAPDFSSGITHSQFQGGDAELESVAGLKEQDGKKQKTEKNPGSRGKSTGKQAKDSSQNEQSSKDDYIHVRARRGQATNSHSLAERVRREKISQRMKYLQDLVPGCDKITGKALMLDEIINYVQSLQRQVEFLSMKLSTVNPELSVDIEQIISKDILCSRVGGSTILGFGPGISLSHTHPHISQGSVDGQLHPVPQIPTIWDDEFQNLIQMGLMPNPALESLGLDGKVGTC
ncbi:hypothetical protein IFM89_022547 [Coptis chinensis]|uniref:BHLH domain-containing protein n=1 Tax=Coptis chinensis TaxID=261450 RepID=A0A835IQ90_9MAGN|nr:hypothetical protein IFM89_022547 [Coptis chinensis]